jgi:PleD family two-component response regulator
MRILVIDDNEDSRDIIEAALMSGGYRDIATAGSAWEALKLLDVGSKAAGAPPAADVILLDVMMPEMDGIECCARIRSDPRYVDTPILMVTSSEDMENLASAFVAGASDYIHKPVNRIELTARVRSALKLKGELERRQERERELLRFLSNWGDRGAAAWIDEATGLLIGEVAEAYLTAITERHPREPIAILGLAVDRLEIVRAAQGDTAARKILAAVADAVRGVTASIGVIATAYRNGVMVVVMPGADLMQGRALGESLRQAVARLDIANRELISADHVTLSVSVASGHVRNGADRVNLFTQAIGNVQAMAAESGDRLVAASA